MLPPAALELARFRRAARSGLPSPSGKLPLAYFEEIAGTDEPDDFVEGLLGRGGASVVYGRPNCGKTFFVLDLGLHVAAGRKWFGKEVEAGAVLYIACEGSNGIKKRIAAFKRHYEGSLPECLPFAMVPVSVALGRGEADVARVVEAAREIAARFGIDVALIVVDTLSRAMGGGDENSAADMGGYIGGVDQIRQRTGAHVISVHHTGKNDSAGARGHSSLLGAIDTEIEVSAEKEGGLVTARVTKQRDFEPGRPLTFRLEAVELGTDRRGRAITTCVVQPEVPKTKDPDALLALQLHFLAGSESMGNHDSEPDDWWRID